MLFLLVSICFGATGDSISGLAQDATGSFVSQAFVISRNVLTGVETKTINNNTGFFALPALPSGKYDLRVERDGFQPLFQKGIGSAG